MNPSIAKLRSRCEPPRVVFDGRQNSTSRVVFVLEHQHRIIGVAHLKRPPPKPRLHLVLEPLV
ncbi:MAG: hypothetical protein OXI15_16005, partial [Chromatiales bacterium]|nr:hypothetical protein [Chromatiales bacterium]